ncbi:MAG: hypothetical protein Kow0059_06450 [Candidatus Sumerlaeia bacterium]
MRQFWTRWLLIGVFVLGAAGFSPAPVAAQEGKPQASPQTTPAPARSGASAVQTARPSRSVRSSSSSGGGSTVGRAQGKYVPPEFKVQADTDASVLMIEPADIRAQVGEEFRTDIALINPRGMEFSSVVAALKYEPQLLEPVRVNTFHSESLLASREAMVYPRQGLVVFRGQFKSPMKMVDTPIFSVRWKALRDADFTKIEFVPLPGGEKTGVLNAAGGSILGGPEVENDGFLSASVSIDKVFDAETLTRQIGSEPVKAGIQLSMRWEFLSQTFEPGTPLRVDVLLDNPQKARFNVVDVEMKFDPEVLEVVDWDTNNWITLGTNVQDGLYRDTFDFTYHITNRVINATGDIIYKMGTVSDRGVKAEPQPLFSILFQVKKPFTETEVAFKMPASVYEDGTRLIYLGRDVLGDPLQPDDGTQNALIRFNP